jgi:FixJ family two-component response regulator
MLSAHGWEVAAFDSAEAFLTTLDPGKPGCLVLDVNLPGVDGLSLQEALSDRANALPIVFLTGAADIPMSVRAMKAGASDFLTKPVSAEALLEAVRRALATAAASRSSQLEVVELQARLARLTAREREVLTAVVAGRLNKQIAGDLGIVEQTVKFHRARLMERMEARTAAELMHIAARLGIGQNRDPKSSDP